MVKVSLPAARTSISLYLVGALVSLIGCNGVLDNPKGHLARTTANGAAGSENAAGANATLGDGGAATSRNTGSHTGGMGLEGSGTSVVPGGHAGASGVGAPASNPSSGGSGGHSQSDSTTLLVLGGSASTNTDTAGQGGAERATQTTLGGTLSAGGAPVAGTFSVGGSYEQSGTPTRKNPRIVKVEPADGTRGVVANSSVVLRFSEPMDTFSVATALAVTDLDASKRTLVWNDTLDTLTIKANEGFSYATGTNTSFAAKAYTVSVGAAARNIQGDHLAADFSSGFYTLRRIAQTIPPSAVYWVNTYATSEYGHYPGLCSDDSVSVGNVTVGYMATARNLPELADVTFALDAMAPPIVVEDALFCAVQISAAETTFYSSGGKVLLSKLAYQSVDNTILSAAIEKREGWLSTSVSEDKPKLNIREYFQNDVMAGRKNLLYSLSPEQLTVAASVQFKCSGFALQITYLAN